jgi:predicted nucleotidyltransferase
MAAERAESIVKVVVDGSFATGVDEPNDVDLLVVVGPAFAENQVLPMVDYNLISKQRVRRRFAFDVLVARDGSPEYERYVEFFSRVRNSPDKRKGSLRVSL